MLMPSRRRRPCNGKHGNQKYIQLKNMTSFAKNAACGRPNGRKLRDYWLCRTRALWKECVFEVQIKRGEIVPLLSQQSSLESARVSAPGGVFALLTTHSDS